MKDDDIFKKRNIPNIISLLDFNSFTKNINDIDYDKSEIYNILTIPKSNLNNIDYYIKNTTDYSFLNKIIDSDFSINKFFYSNNIYKILKNNYSNVRIGNFGVGLQLSKDSPQITADNIGEFVLPLVEYIRETKPDCIIASDRGARIIGLAVAMLYGQLHGKLPTYDGTLRFRRFSKSNTKSETLAHLKPLVNEVLEHSSNPTVLVLDDWICSGGTQTLAKETLNELSKGRIKVKYGVLIGPGSDVSGAKINTLGLSGTTDWRDDSRIIGVDYRGTEAHTVSSTDHFEYRERMREGIAQLAGKMKGDESTINLRMSRSRRDEIADLLV